MFQTPASLLHRLCGQPTGGDWERFVRLFTPLLRRWAERFSVESTAAEDLLQDVFLLLIRKLPTFQYDPERSFRAWLWTIFRRAALAWRKRHSLQVSLERLEELICPDDVAEAAEDHYRRYLLGRIAEIAQSDYSATTWGIFRQVAMEGRPAAEVAEEYGVTLNAVYLVRSRIIARLRQELAELD